MALGDWVAAIKDWANGVAIQETELDQEHRDRYTALYNVVTADAYAGAGGDARIWHGHKSGTFVARPAAAHAGRIYYATDFGVVFIDSGTRWDVMGVNSRLCEHLKEEFLLSNISGNVATLNTANNLGWALAEVVGTGVFACNLNQGQGEARLDTGAPINSSIALLNHVVGTVYVMTSRTPAIYQAIVRTGQTVQQTNLFGLVQGAGATPDGIYFKRIDVAGVANWRAISRQAGVDITNTDTTVVGDTAEHFFEIIIESTASVKFYIDGTLRATHVPNAGLIAANHYLKHYISNQEAVAKQQRFELIEWLGKR